MKKTSNFPPGWNEERVQRILQHDDSLSQDEAVVEDEALLMEIEQAIHHEKTISLDEQLAKRVHREASVQGISVSAFVARTLDDALKRREPSESPPFRLITARGVRPRPGVDLDRPRALDTADHEARFELRQR